MTINFFSENGYIYFGSTDSRFETLFGQIYRVPTNQLLDTMDQLTRWVKDSFDEECWFKLV